MKRLNNVKWISSFLILFFLVGVNKLEAELWKAKESQKYVEGELIVKFKKNVNPAMMGKLLSTFNVGNIVEEKFPGMKKFPGKKEFQGISKLGYKKIKLPKGKKVEEYLEQLKKNPLIEVAEPVSYYEIFTTPNDTRYSEQWCHIRMQSELGWSTSTGGSNITIAIVDTGVDYNHEDLAGKVIKGYDFANNDYDPMDGHGHGTHCSGIASAITNNAKGVAGVSWGAQILAVKVLTDQGSGSNESVANGIIYAADNGAKVISMSLGGTSDSSVVHNAVIYAYNKGCLIVVARGNNGNDGIFYPAAYPECMAISATTIDDTLAYYSSYGGGVSVAAPGGGGSQSAGILSSLPGNNYGFYSGTSMATPQVAGLAALVWSSDTLLTRDEIKNYIQLGVDDLGDVGYDEKFGYGRINVDKTLCHIKPKISHTPSDTENTTSPIPITAVITSFFPLNETLLYYSFDEINFTQVNMISTGNPDEYSGNIPSQSEGTIIYYYFKATIQSGPSLSPVNAPSETWTMRVGIDITPPVITHTPYSDTYIVTEYYISAKVTDNVKVNNVSLFWNTTGFAPFNEVIMSLTGLDTYQGNIPGQSGGTTIYYYIYAKDGAGVPNASYSPSTGTYSFNILPDTEPPQIIHMPLGDTWKIYEDRQVKATITDNAEVINPCVYWNTTGIEPFTEVKMNSDGKGNYIGIIPKQADKTTVYYYITAFDGTNIGRLPEVGVFSFKFILPPVLLIDDDGIDVADPYFGNFDYFPSFKNAMDYNGYEFAVVDALVEPFPSVEILSLFKKVIWWTGEMGVDITVLENLKGYLDQGGKLLVSSDMLDYTNASFIRNYLHSNVILHKVAGGNQPQAVFDEIPNDPISSGMKNVTIVGWNVWPGVNISGVDQTGGFSCLDASTPILKFTTPVDGTLEYPPYPSVAPLTVASRYVNNTYAVVYFAFRLGHTGNISDPSKTRELIGRSISWLDSCAEPDIAGPVLSHTPFGSYQQVKDKYGVEAIIVDNRAVENGYLYWKINDATGWTQVNLTRKFGEEEIFMGDIPTQPVGTNVYYCLSAKDIHSNISRLPVSGNFVFNVVPSSYDTIPPVIVHSPPISDAWRPDKYRVVANIADNNRVNKAEVYWNTTGTTPFTVISMSNISDTYTAFIPGQVSGTMVYYYIESTDDAGNMAREPVSGLHSLVIRKPYPILLVNSNRYRDYTKYNREANYREALSDNGFNFEEFIVKDDDSPNSDILNMFKKVIWFTSGVVTIGSANDGYAAPAPLTANDLINLSNYLDNGGRLFLIGGDLTSNMISDQALAFRRNYLHCQTGVVSFGGSWDNSVRINGVESNPISEGLSFDVLGGQNGGWYAEMMMNLTPLDSNPLFSCVTYGVGTVGVSYENSTYKVVFLDFQFDDIDGKDIRKTIMKRVIDWFGGIIIPTVTDVVPSIGSNLALTTVTITGSGFYGGGSSSTVQAVKLDDGANTSLNISNAVITDMTINGAVVPIGVAIGTYNVKVTTTEGTNTTSLVKYVVTGAPLPIVSNIVPTTGSNLILTTVTITGSGFYRGGSSSTVQTVKLDDGANTSLNISNAVITDITINGAVVPIGVAIGTYNVKATAAGGTNITSAVKYAVTTSVPTVSNINPNTGSNLILTTATITGSGFYGGLSSSTVTGVKIDNGINNYSLEGCNMTSDSIMNAIVPGGCVIGTYDVKVTAAGGTNITSVIKYVITTFVPTVSNIYPTTGSNLTLTTVSITGSGFYGGGNNSIVTVVKLDDGLNTSLNISNAVITDTTISGAVVPKGIDVGTYNVKVTAGGTNLTSAVQYIVTGVPFPRVNNINPVMGSNLVLTTVTITGSGFYGGGDSSTVTGVKIDSGNYSYNLTGYSITSDSVIVQTIVPIGCVVGTYNVQVTALGGTNLTSAVKYVVTGAPLPIVSNIYPIAGSNLETTTVSITGSGFYGGGDSSTVTSVKIDNGMNSYSLDGYNVTSDSTIIHSIVPIGCVVGSYNVQVTAAGGTNITSAVQYKVTTGSEIKYTHRVGWQKDRNLVLTSDGKLVVFYGTGGSYGYGGLYYKISSDGGDTWGNETLVTTSPEDFVIDDPALHSSVCKDASDNIYIIVLVRVSDVNRSLIMRKMTYDSGNYTLEPKYTVEDSFVGYPSITKEPSSGRIWVAYQSGTYSNPVTRVKYSDDDGVSWSLGSDVMSPKMFAALVIWNGYPVVVASSGKDANKISWSYWNGSNWSTPVDIPETFCNRDFSVCITSNNYIHTIYVDGAKVKYIYYDGISWSSPTVLQSAFVSNVALTTDGVNLWGFWSNEGEGDMRIVYRKYNGVTWEVLSSFINDGFVNWGSSTVYSKGNVSYVPMVWYSRTTKNIWETSYLKFGKIKLIAPFPEVSNIVPSTGSNLETTTVSITGTGFYGEVGSSTVQSVKLDDGLNTSLNISNAVITDTTISGAVVPIGIVVGTYNVQVAALGGTNATSAVQYVVTGAPFPEVNNIVLSTGSNLVLTTVLITGSGFHGGLSSSTIQAVKLDDGANTSLNITNAVITDTTISGAVVPMGVVVGTYNVKVTAAGGTNTTSAIKYIVTTPAPAVAELVPSSGYDSSTTTVSITGSGFYGGLSSSTVIVVKLNDGAKTSLNLTNAVITDTTISGAVVPTGIAGGTYDVQVTAAGGTNLTSAVKFVVKSGPKVTNVVPSTGSNLETTTVSITGSGFYGEISSSAVTAVKLDDGLNTSLNITNAVITDTSINGAIVPTGIAIGTYNVKVTAGERTNLTSAVKYIVTTPGPTVTDIVPPTGSNLDLTTVSITGSGFYGGLSSSAVTAVKLDDGLNTSLNITNAVITDTTISGAVVPMGVAGGTYNVKVTAAGGTNT
ncbi:MAG: S8 family serine peptidase, partial [Candidatus Firestonebacteria bacterium]